MKLENDGYGYLHVNFASLGLAGEDLNAAHRRMVEALIYLRERLGSVEWDSASRDFFNSYQAQWDASADHMARSLYEFATGLGNIQDHYHNTELKATLIWTQ